jgi:hypothetical protein
VVLKDSRTHWAFSSTGLKAGRCRGISDFRSQISDLEKRDAAIWQGVARRETELTAWVKNPIDAFVLARLLREGLAPSPPHRRIVLCRRLYLDLLGLPLESSVEAESVRLRGHSALNTQLSTLLSSLTTANAGRGIGSMRRVTRTPTATRRTPPRMRISLAIWVSATFNRDLPYNQFIIEQPRR